MGTTAQKLEYLGTTKSQLKDMISYGLETPLSNETFREYVSSLFQAFINTMTSTENITWNNLPKITGTGTNISLNNTIEAPMRIELGATELTQAGTPTPSSPQDIHTISGSNKVVVNGKNFLPPLTDGSLNGITINTNNPSFTINGTNTTSTTLGTTYFTLPAGTYRVSKKYVSGSTTGFGMIICRKDGENNDFWSNSFNETNYTTDYAYGFTLTETTTFRYYFYTNSAVKTFNNLTYNIQIVSGTTTDYDFEPYTSQEADIDLDTLEYCKIGNYEDKLFRTSGKNLLNFGTQTFVRYYQQTDLNIPSGTYTFSAKVTSSDTTYTISRVYFYNSGGTSNGYIDLTRGTRASGTITTTDTTTRIILYASRDNSSSQNINATYEDIMLNEGTTALPYEPYGSKEWYIKKNIGKVVLDGTENWVIGNTGTANWFYRLNSFYYGLVDLANAGICSHYSCVIINNNNTTEGIGSSASGHNLFIRYGTEDTIENWKSWLSSNNVSFYYVLSTPTYTQITGTLAEQLENVYQKMLSQTGQTNISQINNDLSFNLSVQAIEGI